jgi:RES domain-containing protein
VVKPDTVKPGVAESAVTGSNVAERLATDLTVWRISSAAHAASAMSGEGARLYGGRWNPKDVAVVYTASTQSLAMLEMLVQDIPLRARYVVIPILLPADTLIERLAVAALPDGWRVPQPQQILRKFGADWVRRQTSAVLAVPSAVIPHELNYLLNPQHPAFARFAAGEAQTLATDLRLFDK